MEPRLLPSHLLSSQPLALAIRSDIVSDGHRKHMKVQMTTFDVSAWRPKGFAGLQPSVMGALLGRLGRQLASAAHVADTLEVTDATGKVLSLNVCRIACSEAKACIRWWGPGFALAAQIRSSTKIRHLMHLVGANIWEGEQRDVRSESAASEGALGDSEGSDLRVWGF